MSLLSRISQMTQLSPEAGDWLEEHTHTFRFDKGELVLLEHEVCDYLYFTVSGMLCGSYMAGDKEVCNWIAIEDDFATSYYSFLSGKPSYEVIECLEKSVIQGISRARIDELYRLFPETERAGRQIFEEYYLRLEERLISLQFRSARERYELLFQKRPEIIRRAPLGRIASYLGMTQETLSRIRGVNSVEF